MLLLGAVVLVVLVMSVVVFPSSRFLVSGGRCWGGGLNFFFCYCFASCFSSCFTYVTFCLFTVHVPS